MASVVIAGDVSGTCTLQAANAAGTTVLNLPTTSGTLVATGGAPSFTTVTTGLGNAAAPSITFTGDTNTGIFSPTADTIAFTEGGVESLRINSSGNAIFAQTANLPNTFGFKNRIINGNMAIAQRGTSAVTTDESFPVDRFQLQVVNANLSLVQSSTAPAGFNYSIAATVTSTTSATVLDRSRLFQNIEGFNVADLDWGTANAKTITISFWARSTVTGTYSGNVTNGGGNRSYIFTYALTANTWTYVTATIAGDTSGTWLKTNGNGLGLNPITFNCGANYQGTAGSWIAGDARGTSGSTYLATSNSGAVFNITGVQLEVGSTATSFDYRPYGTELMLCQRYYETGQFFHGAYSNAANDIYLSSKFQVTKRANPTVAIAAFTGSSGFASVLQGGTVAVIETGTTMFYPVISGTTTVGIARVTQSFTASAEL